jgi:crotonobetainyl-CoA:carnitine CoA-transferase CaiB-like acyl-CoA transferase
MNSALDEILQARGMTKPDPGEVTITGADPVFSARFKAGETCAAAIAAIGVGVSDIWQLKTGRRQRAAVDVRHAAAALRSSHHLERADADGRFQPVANPDYQRLQYITRPWPTKDGHFFLPHFSMPHLERRVLEVLDCEATPDAVSAAVARWNALELEAAIDRARACGAMVRSNAEWLNEEHGRILAARPVVEIVKIGHSAPEPMPAGERPLSGIRVLDLTRVLAGPVAARTLAEHGAEVLMVGAEGVPQMIEHVMDTSHGKRSCYLDLKDPAQAERLKALVRQADVFSQGYRPGALTRLGFAPEQLAALRPGIVYCSISCFGADGPLSHRAGWEQIAQTVAGLCHENNPHKPRLVPAPICDYTTGYLGAYGVLLALARRAREGGSYHVRVSLCQSAMLIYRQGRVEYSDKNMDVSAEELERYRTVSQTPYGTLKHLKPVLQLSETEPHWSRPSPLLGKDRAEWPDRMAAA